LTFGPKNQSFRNSIYVDMSTGDNVQGILGAIGPFLGKLGLARVPRSASFLCGNPDDLLGTSQRSILTKFGHETYLGIPSWNPKDIFENFHFKGHLPPKSEIENRSNRHLTQSRLGHGMHCRDILFTPHCSPRARKFPRSGQLFCTT